MNVLGIETSCDETAAAVVRDGRELLSNVVATQIDIHKAYGGVVPEIAARSHIEVVLPVITEALGKAGLGDDPWKEIDAIAVTRGAGLSGSLLIGVLTARTLAWTKNKPLYGVNHVEGHVYANWLDPSLGNYPEFEGAKDWKEPEFPVLALIVSGGHSQLVLFEDHGRYRMLGRTLDDAVGEAFDKVAKIVGLPYPGGPSVAKAAEEGDPAAYRFPKSRLENPYDYSFSGLKTAVLRKTQEICGKDYTFPSHELPGLLDASQRNDIAASFQRVAVETLVESVRRAYDEFAPRSVVIAGGVAANRELRRQLSAALPDVISYAHPSLCTDNAAMIATLGYYEAQRRQPDDPFSLSIDPSLRMSR